MPHKPITPEELFALANGGARIDVEKDPKEPVVITEMDSLIQYVRRIAKANEALVQKQNVHIEEVLDRLVGEMKKDKMDMTPLVSLLADIRLNTRTDKQGYTFNIQRDGRGRMDSVDVTPKNETVN